MSHRLVASDRRALLVLALASLLLSGMPALAAPAHADHAPDHQPVARVELVIHRIIVHDDADWGEGEFKITARVWEAVGDCGEYWWSCDERELARALKIEFGADDDETVAVNRVLPGPGGWAADPSIGPGIGIPMYPGRRYGFEIKGVEVDTFFDDDAGLLQGVLTEQNGWGPLGRYTERGLRGRNPLDDGPNFGFCNVVGFPPDTCLPAYFSVEYELRRAPVPDLNPTSIKVLQLPGTTDDTVCMGVVNREGGNAGPFQMALRVNGVIPPGGIVDAGKLDAGNYGELCVPTRLPASARLSVSVDEAGQVLEYNETNNHLEQPYVSARTDPGDRPQVRPGIVTADPGAGGNPGPGPLATGPATGPGPLVLGPAEGAQADLVVAAIRVQDEEPGGRSDCNPGKNDVTVVIRNVGAGPAAAFAVRVVVDGEDDDAVETAAASLEAGKETSVTFKDVRLRRGERRLAATADITKAIAESDEGNNELKATVRCRDEG